MEKTLNLKAQTPVSQNTILYALTPILLLLISVGLLWLVVYPSYQAYPTKKAEVEALETKNTLLETKLKKINDLEDFKELVEENSKILNVAIPSERQVPLLLTQIKEIAEESGLEVTNLTYSSSETGIEATTGVAVQLAANGSYTQLRSFVQSVENASRILDFSTLRYSYIGERNNNSPNAPAGIQLTTTVVSQSLQTEAQAITEQPIDVDIRDQEFLGLINKLKTFRTYETQVDNNNIGKENPFNQ